MLTAILLQRRPVTADLSFGKLSPAYRGNLPQAPIADSSSRNAVSFSSACTTKRFPSPRFRFLNAE